MKYKVVGMGGSFDHFHAGHDHFLRFAANQAEHLLIGVSTETLISNKAYPSTIESFEQRLKAVEEWCKKNNVSAEVLALNDPFGPTLSDKRIEAVAVTTETLPGGELINTERGKLGLAKLPLLVCELVQDENGNDIHASRIRAGEISRLGTVYSTIFKNTYKLREKQREYFSRPKGTVTLHPQATDLPSDSLRCLVGDYTVEYCTNNKIIFNLGVIDHKQQREKYHSSLLESLPHTYSVHNPAGEISVELVDALQKLLQLSSSSALENPQYLHVDGEEDLAAVVLFLLLPLGCEVWYGQPHEGTVCVTITEQFKEEVYQVLAESNSL